LKITLGTVQFGINYGIANTHGVPADEELKSILATAKEHDINYLDTAHAYGNAEERLGLFSENRFNIITKFPAVKTNDELQNVLSLSLDKLNCSAVYGYLAHNADTLIENPFLWETLLKAKEEKKINKIGFSLYSPEQLERLIALNCIPDIVQLPYSILDRKFANKFQVLKGFGTEIHVRSVFLQGLYFMDPEGLPEKLSDLKPALLELHNICKENNVTVSDVALNYAVANPFIDQVVIGVDTTAQLKENIRAVSDWRLENDLFSRIETIAIKNKTLLNPVNW